MANTCKFSTYGYACGKPVEHGRYLCADHAAATCSSCGKPATHGCDFCGQFVCGAPLCDECTFGTDESKSSGAWGFMNHIHVSKPEFADKHRLAVQEAALAAKHAEIARLREALEPFAKAADIKLCGEWKDHERFSQTDVGFHLSFGDLRSARAALKEKVNA